jgi:hypothetical protein
VLKAVLSTILRIETSPFCVDQNTFWADSLLLGQKLYGQTFLGKARPRAATRAVPDLTRDREP